MSTFFIPDTSPIFAFSPCSNCGALDRWQSAYTPRGDGYDQTFHQSATVNSSVSFNLSVNFRTGMEGGQCDARYSIDGADYVDGCAIAAFPSGRHTVSIRPQEGVRALQFYGVTGTAPAGGDASNPHHNATADNTASNFAYTGPWTWMTAKGPTGQPANQTVASVYSSGIMSGFFNSTAGITTAEGAGMTLTFEGSGVYVYGVSGPDGGNAEVKLDGVVAHRLNMTNPWRAYSSLLFFATGLETTQHQVTITNLSPGRQLVLDYALITSAMPVAKSSGPNLPLIVGTIAGVSAFLLIVGVCTYLYCLRRRGRTPTRQPPTGPASYGFATGLAYNDITPAKASSIDSWRKNAMPETPSSGSASGSGSSSASGYKFYAAHIQPGSGRFEHSPGRSPPPEYPDYLPYRGPIEMRPPSPLHDPEPPAIAGLNARTQGWLTAASAVNSHTPNTGSTFASARSGGRDRSIHRPDPIPLRTRNDVPRSEMEDIPLDSYYAQQQHHQQQDLISPASTLSSLGFTSMATRAMGARSVARLWPSSTATDIAAPGSRRSFGPETPTPSTGGLSGAGKGYSESSITPTRPERPGRALSSSNSIQYAPTYTYAGHFAQNPEQLIGSGISPASLAAWRTPSRTSDQHHPASPPLRRGVSIKSAKTMRSFFSGLLWNSPVPDTPALPSSYDGRGFGSALGLALGSGVGTGGGMGGIGQDVPARPDSDIFPSASVSRSGSVSRGHGHGYTQGQGSYIRSEIETPLPPLPPSAAGSAGSYTGGGGIPTTKGLKIRKDGRADTRVSGLTTRTSLTSLGLPPMLRLDTGGGENIFIELNPNSPVTMVGGGGGMDGESRWGSEPGGGGGGGGGWRYGNRV